MIGGAFRKLRTSPDALFVGGRRVRLTPSLLIGSGGEADVFDIGVGKVLKRYKGPHHPDFAHSPAMQQGAADRLREQQSKLPALLRRSLPPRVVAPIATAVDGAGLVCGYTMPLVQDAEVLFRYADPAFRNASGATRQDIVTVMQSLHETVTLLHAAGVVIGDFNDLNVLVRGTEAWLIDIDSAQFGPFLSQLYTTRFLDPRLTDGTTLAPARPHDTDSDWYAFTAMAFHQLLLLEPFGGTWKPPGAQQQVPHGLRPLHGISVFNPAVRRPRQALPFDLLPDELLHHFHAAFESRQRGVFPAELLALHWTRCACGTEHARLHCPACATAAPRVARPMRIVTGRLAIEPLFETTGAFLEVAVHGDSFLWLEHRDGAYRRERGLSIDGPVDAGLSFALQKDATIIRRRDSVRVVGRDSASLRAESIATNSRHRYWTSGGTLHRDGSLGPEVIGHILGGQTRFWVGERFGFGFYRASELTVAFVFDAERHGIRDDVALPRIGGQVIAADAVFADERCWFLVATQEGGRVRHRCTVIRSNGSVEATREIEPDDHDWLSRIHGNAAAGAFMLVATDDGVVRVEPDRGSISITATFPETEELVDRGTRLLIAPDGLIAVSASRIVRLRMS